MTTSSSLLETLSRTDGEVLAFFSFIFLVVFIVLTGIISRLIYFMHRNRMEAELKQSLVEQGFTADEIAKIVEATAGGKKRHGR